MDKEIKKEFNNINNEFEKLAIMVKNGFDQTATKEDLEEVKEDLESVKEDLKTRTEDLGGKIDEVSAKLQEQKNVPLIKKVNEKLDKEIEIHKSRGTLSQEDVKEIKELDPFSSKPAVAP